ncbi:acetyltransferase (GNAT) domain protein [Leptospira noguchii str. 1993005606]|uniref:Acetyltransferase (GNAT) domain protein n=2 Tax=Leptospira noguchii TaxID=28182 RepID=M6Y3R0_9LEPT|nr:GNAT family N-acetyltransferase [Leptospira noguchii]EMN01226.1 acetyltransferase (GNAT) domain protein [Leptospira noguchii str. 2007001578]EMO88335.1 acetyltransferase (GNAT) domain protein [Leptospira noguchii str. 2001034031]EPE84876.1 acetyltransferase (GNAT) domain protein [Leptospira noguchii str. 1993005606]
MLEKFLLDATYDNEIVAFLNKISKSNYSVLGYHYPNYRKMLEKIDIGKPLYLGLRDNKENIVAILPGFIKTQKEGSVYSSLPFFGPNAGILFDKNSINQEQAHLYLLQFLFHELKNYDMVSASLYSNFYDNSDFPLLQKFIPDSITLDKFTSYISLYDFKLSSSLEYDIRKATRSGVKIREVRTMQDVEDIYNIYKQNCIDYGILLKPKECLKSLVEQSKSINTVKTYIAEYSGRVIGALIMIYSPSIASYYLPCSIHEYRSYQPMTFLINHAIQESIRMGIHYWNWESSPSKESGVYRFKKKWGSMDKVYKIFIKPFKDIHFFRKLGRLGIGELYPHYFVYPFSEI